MLASVRSATLIGVDGHPVTVEVHVSSGLPAYSVVGLPDTAVRERAERAACCTRCRRVKAWPLKRNHRQPRQNPFSLQVVLRSADLRWDGDVAGVGATMGRPEIAEDSPETVGTAIQFSPRAYGASSWVCR